MKNMAIIALCATTALVPAAYAQDSASTTAQSQECKDLAVLITNYDFSNGDMTRDQALLIANRDNPQDCTNTADKMKNGASTAQSDMSKTNKEVDASARLRVLVPPPDVNVEQAAPQVDVKQAQPDVNVNPGRPVVTVNQAKPTVHVKTTPPTITIDMPRPQITVEMPDPTVDVNMAQPRVTVNQPKPKVDVMQGDVQIKMGDKEQNAATSGQGNNADVNIDQKKADVQVEQPMRSNIEIQNVKPEVRYNAAQPDVQIENSGDPQVQFNQSGKADVTFRQMTADETRAAAAQNNAGQSDNSNADNQNSDQSSDLNVSPSKARNDKEAMPNNRGEMGAPADATPAQANQNDQSNNSQTDSSSGNQSGQSSNQTADGNRMANDNTAQTTASTSNANADQQKFSAQQLLEMDVIGSNGDDIGGVNDVVIRGDTTYIIVGTGGFFGLGEKEVALPLSSMTVRNNQLVLRQLTQDEVDNMQETNVDQFKTAPAGQQYDVRTGTNS